MLIVENDATLAEAVRKHSFLPSLPVVATELTPQKSSTSPFALFAISYAATQRLASG